MTALWLFSGPPVWPSGAPAVVERWLGTYHSLPVVQRHRCPWWECCTCCFSGSNTSVIVASLWLRGGGFWRVNWEWAGPSKGHTTAQIQVHSTFYLNVIHVWKAKLEPEDECESKMVLFFTLRFSLGSGRGICLHCRVARLFPFSRARLVNLYWHRWTHTVAVWLASYYHLLSYLSTQTQRSMTCRSRGQFLIISHFGLFPLILCKLDRQPEVV